MKGCRNPLGDKQRENVGAQLMSTGFVGGISIRPDCARTRSQWRQVKRRVVIDPPSRTKYYTGCPSNTVVTSPTSSGYQPRPPKPISSSRSVLRSRLSRAGPREHRPARCTPPPGDLKIRRCAHRSGAESLSGHSSWPKLAEERHRDHLVVESVRACLLIQSISGPRPGLKRL